MLYHLFPNIQLVVSKESTTLIRIYPAHDQPGQSLTRVSFYFAPQIAEQIAEADARNPEAVNVYSYEDRQGANAYSLAASLEVFKSTIENEDYVMGEMQQKAAESGLLREILFGRNEPALHHFHNNYREALGEPPLERPS